MAEKKSICLNCNGEGHTEKDCPYKHEPTVPSENDELLSAPNLLQRRIIN